MITLIYHGKQVGPVCRHIAVLKPDQINVVRDTDPLPDGESVLLRWGSVLNEYPDRKVLNPRWSVSLAKDKIASRQTLKGLCPETWTHSWSVKVPCVIRPKQHHGGFRFYVCRTPREVRKAIRKCEKRGGWYASPIVDKAREFRVFVLQGRVVRVSERLPNDPSAIAWNYTQGNSMKTVKRIEWPLNAVLASLQGCSRMGLDWAAVDVAIDRDGKAVIFEMNTQPGLSGPRALRQIARAFAWAGVNDYPEAPRGESVDDLLHPALVKKPLKKRKKKAVVEP